MDMNGYRCSGLMCLKFTTEAVEIVDGITEWEQYLCSIQVIEVDVFLYIAVVKWVDLMFAFPGKPGCMYFNQSGFNVYQMGGL